MQVYKIILSIIEKPHAPKHYRELRSYFEQKSLVSEIQAIDHLIEKKFGKNNVIAVNDSSDNKKQ